MDVEIHENERVDALFSNGIKIIQSSEVFSFSLDAVLLADFANPAKKKEQKIVDLCAGNGAVGLFLTPKSSAQIYEVEIQPRLADMAKRSIDLNGLEERVTVINDDLNNVFDYLAKDSIDTVTCNPPYFEDQPDSKKNPNQYLALARHELAVTLEQTIEQASGLLKMNGRVSYVQFVYPKRNREANMVLVEAIKDGKPGGLRFMPPLFVYEENGEYTEEVRKIVYG